jgi:hypothetical protein
MKFMRMAFVGILFSGLIGCGFLNSQLSRDPATGESKLEAEVKAAQPVLGPYGALATALATLAAGVYGAFHAKGANENTKEEAPTPAPKPV